MNTPVTFETVTPETIPIRALNAKPGPVRAKHIVLVDDVLRVPAPDPVDEATGPQPGAARFVPPSGHWERWGLNE